VNHDRNKLLFTAFVLLGCLGVSIWGNQLTFDSSDAGKAQRTPASHILEQLRSGTVEIERKLASQIASFKNRRVASLGRSPDPLENFRFGILEGKYALTMNGDKISDISFIDTPGSEGRPTAVANRLEFLKQNNGFFGATSLPEKVATDVRGTKITETYRMKTALADQDIIVKITVDDLDRLIDVKTERVSSLKLF
jgi:ribosomal protein L20